MSKKKTEAEVLGELDALFADLDDGARKRALDWLRAKHIANANLPEATGAARGAAMIGGALGGATGIGRVWDTRVIC